jgi:hypothetical protein
VCVWFFVCFLSPLVWFFLWLLEEVLTLLFLLHCEDGDFSFLMKDIVLDAHISLVGVGLFWLDGCVVKLSLL